MQGGTSAAVPKVVNAVFKTVMAATATSSEPRGFCQYQAGAYQAAAVVRPIKRAGRIALIAACGCCFSLAYIVSAAAQAQLLPSCLHSNNSNERPRLLLPAAALGVARMASVDNLKVGWAAVSCSFAPRVCMPCATQPHRVS